MGVAQLFVSFRGALPIADLCPLFFVEAPVPQDPGLPEERNTGNSEMVALLTALSQVHPRVPLFHRELEEPYTQWVRQDTSFHSSFVSLNSVLHLSGLGKGSCIL